MLSRSEKYLGLPSTIEKKYMNFFNDVKRKILSKISNWQHKFFVSGGKELLIKVVAHVVLLAYVMSVFKVPVALYKDIYKAIARFWWGSQKDKHSISPTKMGKNELCQA